MVVEGKGSFGIVLSSPRIPILDEKYEDVINLNQVSKLLYSVENNIYYPDTQENIVKVYDNILKLAKDYPLIFNEENFILPIKGGYINKNEFIEKFNRCEYGYGYEWISKSMNSFNILKQLFSDKNEIFQVVYEKGTQIKYDFNSFLDKMVDIYNLLIKCDNNGFYFDDLKFNNLIVHNNKIKIIDFDEPINLNLSEKEYSKIIADAKFHNIMYFPYDTISNLLLYEFTGYTRKIGYLNKNNYYKLLHTSTIEYIDNVKYKLNVFNILIDLWKKYLKNYTVEVQVYNLESFNFEELDTNNFDFEYHFNSGNSDKMLNENRSVVKINLNMFIESIEILYISYIIKQYKNHDIYDINKIIEIINEIFILNKKFIKLTKKTDKDIISFLLFSTNIYSYGFIFLDWLKINKSNISDMENKDDILKKIIGIVIKCCLNFVIIDNNICILDRNYINLKIPLNL